MDQAGLEERTRLIREGSRHADAARRSWSFTVQVVVALGLFALAPLIPHAHHLFGALSVGQLFLFVTPGALGAVISLVVYRRFGGDGRAYRIAEAMESFFMYASNTADVFGTEMTWPVLWILCPFTMVFWAVTKPFAARLHLSIVAASHTALALAYVARGDAARAWVAVGVGVACAGLYLVISREGRKQIALEAERNVAQAKLSEALLDEARRRIATTLQEGIGQEILGLARELESDVPPGRQDTVSLAEQANATLTELGDIVDGNGRHHVSCSLGELIRRLDDKCRPLCAHRAYESVVAVGDDTRLVDAPLALAIVRVAQELVRNAIVHGDARSVQVELALTGSNITLRVLDNGSGLSRERFARATGGLDNAMTWLREHGGGLDLLPSADGTALRATLPLPCALQQG